VIAVGCSATDFVRWLRDEYSATVERPAEVDEAA